MEGWRGKEGRVSSIMRSYYENVDTFFMCLICALLREIQGIILLTLVYGCNFESQWINTLPGRQVLHLKKAVDEI